MDPESNSPPQEISAVPGSDHPTRSASQSNSTLARSESGSNLSSDSSNAAKAYNEPDPVLAQKRDDILAACNWKDVGRLRCLAQSKGGLLTDALRRRAWPLLLGLEVPSKDESSVSGSHEGLAAPNAAPDFTPVDTIDWRDLPRHRDEDQVQLDVNRSFIYYPSSASTLASHPNIFQLTSLVDLSDAELSHRKAELSALINEILRRYPYLCYFQGYHDICQVLLLVLEPQWRARTLARLSVLRIRDFMLPSFAPTTSQLRLLPDIISSADPKLRQHLAGVEPFYALAGTLTMYSHNIEGYRDIARLFDVFLAREPVFSIYVFAQIILDRRDEVFEIDEPDMLHVILGKVPATMDLDKLVIDAAQLFEKYPPEALPSWRRISNSSALKTARNVEDCTHQTIEEGEEWFHRQVQEVQWAEVYDRVKFTLWAYRRPVRAISMAVAVGALAFYLRRNPSVINRIMAFFSR